MGQALVPELRSIPAGAGETLRARVFAFSLWVDPRGCGGDREVRW